MVKVLIGPLLCFVTHTASAGYWLKGSLTVASAEIDTSKAPGSKKQGVFKGATSKTKQFASVRHKNVAVLLALLAIFPYTAFLGCGGLHRLYMGYENIWMIQLAGTLGTLLAGTILLMFILFAHAYTLWMPLTVVLAIGGTIYLWEWVDFFRILSGSLQPKNGNWPTGSNEERRNGKWNPTRRYMKDE